MKQLRILGLALLLLLGCIAITCDAETKEVKLRSYHIRMLNDDGTTYDQWTSTGLVVQWKSKTNVFFTDSATGKEIKIYNATLIVIEK